MDKHLGSTTSSATPAATVHAFCCAVSSENEPHALEIHPDIPAQKGVACEEGNGRQHAKFFVYLVLGGESFEVARG
eukprot:366572-Chlamydomonas_euryale.AAC.5